VDDVRLTGWDVIPSGYGARFDANAAPFWLRVLFQTPFVDRFAYPHLEQSEDIWSVQASGDHYICGACSMPPGATGPKGDYITTVLRASDFESTDGGLGPHSTDLAALGDVQVLRDE
jgi:hypothetical protein